MENLPLEHYKVSTPIGRTITLKFLCCSPWSSQVHPFPSLMKKNIENPFCPTHTYPDRPNISPFARSHIPKRKKVKTPKKRRRTENQRANKKQSKVRRLEGHFQSPKEAMHTFTLASMPAMEDHYYYHYHHSEYPSSYDQPTSPSCNCNTY